MPSCIRVAVTFDAPAFADIYNRYISNATITFEEVEVTAKEMARRIENVGTAKLPWCVSEADGHSAIAVTALP